MRCNAAAGFALPVTRPVAVQNATSIEQVGLRVSTAGHAAGGDIRAMAARDSSSPPSFFGSACSIDRRPASDIVPIDHTLLQECYRSVKLLTRPAFRLQLLRTTATPIEGSELLVRIRLGKFIRKHLRVWDGSGPAGWNAVRAAMLS